MGKGELVGRVREMPLVGGPRGVFNVLTTLDSRGELAEWPRRYRQLRDGRVAVNVRFIDRRPPARKPDRALRRIVVTMASAFPAAGLAGLVVELATGDLLLVMAFGFAALFLAAGLVLRLLGGDDVGVGLPGFSTCQGVHCSGCSNH